MTPIEEIKAIRRKQEQLEDAGRELPEQDLQRLYQLIEQTGYAEEISLGEDLPHAARP
jgi:hypothetical protein